MRDHIPPGYNSIGLNFLLYGRRDVIGPGFADYIGRLVAKRVAVFLSIRGPDGFSDAAVLLNDHLSPAVASGDRAKALSILHDAVEALTKNKFEPAVFKHRSAAQTR